MDVLVQFFTIMNRIGFKWTIMHSFWALPPVFYKLVFYILRHGDINILILIVPIKGDATIKANVHVNYNSIE